MPDLAPDKVYFILAFIVPGLIASFVRSQFITGRNEPHKDAVLSYLVLSVFYYALALPALEYTLSLQGTSYHRTLAWFSLVFIGPAVFGLLLGLNAQKEWTRRALKWLGLHPVHVMPTAWDWKFAGTTEQWVLVTLKNGTRFAGFAGIGSFMSSDQKERDVYVERIYDVGEDNTWTPRGDNGVLIAAGEISTIEFWPYHRTEITNEQEAGRADLPQPRSEGLPASDYQRRISADADQRVDAAESAGRTSADHGPGSSD